MDLLIKNKLKKDIINEIETHGGTDHGFMSRIENYCGDKNLVNKDYNIVLFSGISEEAAEVLSEIINSGKYKFYRASALALLSYPNISNLPMAHKANHKYKELRYYPLAIEKGY